MDHKYEYTVKVTPEEFVAMSDLVTKMRKEKAKEQAIKEAKMAISFEVSHAISEIGLEETKRIVREIARDLRQTER